MAGLSDGHDIKGGTFVRSALVPSIRMLAAAGVLAASILGGAVPGSVPASVDAASCVRFNGSNWDAPGDDNYMPQLNQEWVRIKNFCSTAKSVGGWKIHDLNQNHVYRFASGVSIGAGKTITLHSGTGSNTASHRYWGFSYGAVWNNTGPERAFLKNGAGTQVSTWVE